MMRKPSTAVTSSSSITLLLLLACAATWPASDGRAVAQALPPAPERGRQVPMQAQLPWPWNFLLPPSGDPGVVACWRSLLATESCVVDLFRFLFDHQLSEECCRAVRELGASCVPAMFMVPPFGGWFPPMIQAACPASPRPSAAFAQAPAPHRGASLLVSDDETA